MLVLCCPWLLGCWSPDASVAPELPPLVAPAEPEEAEDPEDPPPPEPPEATPFDEYVAWTTTPMVSLVDDVGKPIAVLDTFATEVEVQAEDELRKRVWCGGCTPRVEGWAQRSVITDRGKPKPEKAAGPPPGAPSPNQPLTPGAGAVPPPPKP